MGETQQAADLVRLVFGTKPGLFGVALYVLLFGYLLLVQAIGTKAERTLDRLANNRLNDIADKLADVAAAIDRLTQRL